MIFQRKYERAMKNLEEKNAGSPKALQDDDLSNKVEKGDVLAMILSALIVIVPVALIFLLIAVGAGYFFLIR
ncbi:MAG: hypothetical protein IJ354_00935 [Clostridia bacterium]|nr:hypothetical protein [Clostridia bacterium]